MKLNSMPNIQRRQDRSSACSLSTIITLQLVSALIGTQLTNCHQQDPSTETPNSVVSQPSRDVTNLQLASDFRAVNLNWSYKSHGEKDRPACFDVRYCEMTSWNIEIKCRHRDMQVSSAKNQTTRTGTNHEQTNLVQHLDGPLGSSYEARIYDLRALTNYTFQVKVSRFQNEKTPPQTTPGPVNNISTSSNRVIAERRQRTQAAARQLGSAATLAGDEAKNMAGNRIETKPFGAEATKCLADVSEVLVNTGRYFGGRISVEDSQDPRCNLIGNKSSEQETYLFRIDHEICASKLVDGNRIETMVLVHENKDILTHNTARFLVLCNFQQTRSFTLRASVSLPKVNGLSGSRPAVITSLPGRPIVGGSASHQQNPSANDENLGASHVMLGSMPGIYRSRGAFVNSTRSSPNVDVELETNTIQERKPSSFEKKKELRAALGGSRYETDGFMSVAESANSPTNLRQAKELTNAGNTNNDNQTLPLRRHPNNARTLISSVIDNQLVTDSHRQNPPQPVQVQSKVLFIERGSGGFSRGARHHKVLDGLISGGKQQLQVMTSNHSPQPQQASSSASNQIESTAKNQQIQIQNQQHNTDQLLSQQHATSPAMPKLTLDATSPAMPKLTLDAPNAQVDAAQFREPRKLRQQELEVMQQANVATTPTIDNMGKKPHSLTRDELHKFADDSTSASTPIIMTNNHRVAGDYLPVSLVASRAAAAKSFANNSPAAVGDSAAASEGDGFSIKYSAAKVDEYPLSSASASLPPLPLIEFSGNGQLVGQRVRSGRMHRIKTDSSPHDAGRSMTMLPNYFEATNQPPVWAVNRMGELMAEGGDLASAETTNETQSGDQSDGQVTTSKQPTLAANLTTALLKWSLKTLGNLAKMSLETLAESSLNSTTNANATHANDPPVESQTDSPQLQAISSSTIRPLLVTSVVQQPTKSSLRQVSSTTTAPIIHKSARPVDEQHATELDGFITSDHRQRSQASMRPSNYSKSLDLSRILGSNSSNGDRRSKVLEKNGARSSEQQQHVNSNESSQKVTTTTSSTTTTSTTTKPQRNHHRRLNESGANGNRLQASSATATADNLTFYSSWIFYGMILVVATVTGIVLILYLLDSTPLSSSSSGPGAMLGGQINCSAVRPFGDDSTGGDATSCQGVSGGGCSGSISATSNTSLVRDHHHESTSYQRYDYNKFENYPTISASQLHLLQQRQNSHNSRQRSDSCSGGSSDYVCAATATTGSLRSSSSSEEENDCKNNELFFTEHVLINTGQSKFGNESYA